jgi:hypothetical protein
VCITLLYAGVSLLRSDVIPQRVLWYMANLKLEHSGVAAAPTDEADMETDGVEGQASPSGAQTLSPWHTLMRLVDQLQQCLQQRHAAQATLQACAQVRALLQQGASGQLACFPAVKKLRKELLPFDTVLLSVLLGLQQSAVSTVGANEKVFITIGRSGAGKTTALYWLSGCQMEMVKDAHGINHVRPTPESLAKAIQSNPALRELHSRSEHHSATNHLTPVPISLKALGGLIDQTIVVMDAPGQVSAVSMPARARASALLVLTLCSCAHLALLLGRH